MLKRHFFFLKQLYIFILNVLRTDVNIYVVEDNVFVSVLVNFVASYYKLLIKNIYTKFSATELK